jgi:hypothetical protein
VAIVAGVLVASGLTVGSLSVWAESCVPGQVSSVVNDTLTPQMLLNSPYNGSAFGTVPIENGTLNLTLFANNSGGAWGFFDRTDWTIRDGTSPGGASAACRATYFVSFAGDSSSDGLPLFNSSAPAFLNDSTEPNSVQINGTPGPVYFSNGFRDATGEISTCGGSAVGRNLTSTHIEVGVQFRANGATHTADVTIDVSTHYEYRFPANGGSWEIDNLSAPGGPGGGWAFSYIPCS